ncbi:acetoin utilization protein AcuC [Modestobacter sp. I12A-02628]|uniref:Acetoin utilization protein AcuC n=1 Tax=Goekera deserti TaxID=2497753 RepID=A0A7K3WI76_9ACTN|nr:acetoin utilization protein AcuC [Goekera deserti]MPQ96725.1 acetoin utilization protein AcuC [Goekera deserti]NDI46961.1 acetoin utilization protein AcuC [Goekera deserti]NEL56198.1 acetoin utilization protein AcuC [Goekera deserti]
MSDSVAVVWDDALLGYTMGGDHPLHPVRLDLTMRLADSLGVLSSGRVDVVAPTPADVDLLTLVHDADYLDAVRRAPADPGGVGHGLGTPDNPVFEGMYDAAALITGGSVEAARQVHTGAAQHAVNISGGLHHAMRGAAAGFCVFNDAAIAIAWLLGQGYERIAYVDLDVHHGDGVQAAFYGDPRVLTVSIHQTPLTLFPGTGFPEETGDPATAPGSAVNLALPNGTDDSGWLRAFHAVVPSVLRAFAPQILVTQSGCDAHHEDPLADLSLTVDGQRASYQAVHALAHEICDGRWVVLGGGGYGLVRCVPRAWTHLLAEVGGDALAPGTEIPQAWQDDVVRRGLRAQPPTTMTEHGYTGFARWDPFTEHRVDRAIGRTRAASFPLFGLDPDDPRD